MPLYDSDGNAVEGALLPDEAKNLQEEKEKKLKELEEEIAKFKEKDANFSKIRAQQQDAEKQLEELKKELEVKVESAKKEVLEGVLKEHYSEALNELAGGDEELLKKIEQQYNRLSDPATSKAEIDKKLRDAWSLTGTKPTQPNVAFAFSSGSSAPIKPSSSKAKFSDEEKAFGKFLAAQGGISLDDADFQ